MRIVFVHGRAQGEKSEAQLRTDWLPGLAAGFGNAGIATAPTFDDAFPFYGARLDGLTAERRGWFARIVYRGDEPGEPDAVSDFERKLLVEMAQKYGVTDDDVRAAIDQAVIERGPANWEWVQVLGRLIDRKVSGATSKVISTFMDDVHTYLTRPSVRRDVNDLVRSAIENGGPCVVVAHSLGTVVAYDVLYRMAKTGRPASVPLFVTLGSPLGMLCTLL